MKLKPDAIASTWPYAPNKKAQGEGAQLDLLFDRSDDLCEWLQKSMYSEDIVDSVVNLGDLF